MFDQPIVPTAEMKDIAIGILRHQLRGNVISLVTPANEKMREVSGRALVTNHTASTDGQDGSMC